MPTITVKSMGMNAAATCDLHVEATTTVREVKAMLATKLSVPVAKVVLRGNGNILADESDGETIADIRDMIGDLMASVKK
jgi:hypothetical protein